MYKLYLHNFNGQNPSAWDDNWRGDSVDDAVFFAAHNSPYRVDFDRYCLPHKRVIDAGCGLGGFVIYYAKKGCDIVGIDFAKDTVEFLKSNINGIPIECASAEKIPHKDNSFDVYLSIGVMEHFEGGPANILKEARRVLKRDGHLILTVPYVNTSKRIKHKLDCAVQKALKNGGTLRFDKNCNYKKVKGFAKEGQRDFHQYEFTEREVRDFLVANGFRVLYAHGCSIIYGLNFVPILGRIVYHPVSYLLRRRRRYSKGDETVHKEGMKRTLESLDISPYRKRFFVRELLKDAIARENTDNLFLRPFVRVLQRLCGDFLLVVCKPDK